MHRRFGNDDTKRRIKDALDIVDVVGSYIELKPQGSRWVALCPFHAEKTPSFSVNRANQYYHCFGCHKSGDLIDFVMSIEGVSFPEALKMLGDRCGIDVDFRVERSDTPSGPKKNRLYKLLEDAARRFEVNLQGPGGAEARTYLNHRRLGPDLQHDFRLGWAPESWSHTRDALSRDGFTNDEIIAAGLAKRHEKSGRVYDLFRNRLMLPIFDMQGRVLGFGGRVLDTSEPKYINSPEGPVFNKGRLFYGLNRARRALSADRCAVIVEGYTDVIAAHGRGVTHALATLGTALTEDHARQLRRLVDQVVLFFDGDSAGAAAARRGIEMLIRSELDVTVVTPPDQGMDPFDYFARYDGRQFWTCVRKEGSDAFEFIYRQAVAEHGLETEGGVTRVARALLDLVAIQPDAIRRSLFRQRISDRLGIPLKVLEGEASGGRNRRASSRSGGGPESAGVSAHDGVLILRRLEDELILGLVREPLLMDRHREALDAFATEDREAELLLGTMRSAQDEGCYSASEIVTRLSDHPSAKARFIALCEDPRTVDAGVLVDSALDRYQRRMLSKAYEQRKRETASLALDDEEALAQRFAMLKKLKGRSKRPPRDAAPDSDPERGVSKGDAPFRSNASGSRDSAAGNSAAGNSAIGDDSGYGYPDDGIPDEGFPSDWDEEETTGLEDDHAL